mgnify:CR=1 FL=1
METDQEKGNVNKLTNQAVYLLCFLKRYQPLLFSNWKQPDISCFIYLGGCKNETEAMFVKFLARLHNAVHRTEIGPVFQFLIPKDPDLFIHGL